MAWSTSDRAQRLPGDWNKRRARVLKRDGYRCVHVRWDTETRCAHAATEVDHIVAGDDHDLANLQSLCAWHHQDKTMREAAEARRRTYRPSRRRPRVAHPADLQ